MTKKQLEEKVENMSSCMLSILDSLKLADNDSLDLSNETLSEVMFRKMKAHNIDLNKELGFTHLKPIKREVKVEISDFVKNYEVWEECSPNIQILTFDKEPIDTSDSLHIYEEKYEIDGEIYRLLYTIGDDGPPTIEKLKKKSKKFNTIQTEDGK
jgi:hypothetical protein